MYPSREARELAILLRISRELDICGDVTATVDNPSEILAWAAILTRPLVRAWRAQDSGHRFIQVAADHRRAPVRGHVAAVLDCDQHKEFWTECGLDHLGPGETRDLRTADLALAWEAMPITAGDAGTPPRASSSGTHAPDAELAAEPSSSTTVSGEPQVHRPPRGWTLDAR